MLIFTMTQNELPAFTDLLPESVINHVGSEGYFTTAAIDDEGYPLGALQFCVDGDPKNIHVASLEWIYVIPEARKESIAWHLHNSYKNVLLDTKIPISQVDCKDNLTDDIRNFLLALGYKSLGDGRFILNIPRP